MSRAHRESKGLQIAAADQGDRKGRDRLGDHVFRPSSGGAFPRCRRAFAAAYDRLAGLSHLYRRVGRAAFAPVAGPTPDFMAGSVGHAVVILSGTVIIATASRSSSIGQRAKGVL
jgi:hypothetical protein